MIEVSYNWRNPDLPVGVLDSGLGGLSVLREMRRAMPREDFYFACDCDMAPWGDRSTEWIVDRVEGITEFLVGRSVKALVIACNTATAAAIDRIRAEVPFPVVGIEPAVKPASSITRDGVVGVLATTRTVTSDRFQSLVRRFQSGGRVLCVACPGLPEKVERGEFHTSGTRALLRKYIEPLLGEGADTLVLGCTHYPFLHDEIRRIAGDGVAIIDPSPAVARRAAERLESLGILRESRGGARTRFWCTGKASEHVSVLRTLWNENAVMEELAIEPPEADPRAASTHHAAR